MVIVEIENKQYQLKTKYSELTKKQFRIVSHIRSKNLHNQNISQEAFNAIRMNLFYFLSNVPMRKWKEITAVEWVDILPYVNWVFGTPDFEQNPIPYIRIGFTTYYGPIGLLNNSTMEEFTYADTEFITASNSKKEESIYRLMSYLYRPARKDLVSFRNSHEWNGDIREPFNLERAKKRIKRFKRLKLERAVAVFLYYSAFKLKVERSFPLLFNNTGKKDSKNRGWAGALLEISHLPVFGTLDQAKEQPCWTVLYELERQLDISKSRTPKTE